MEKLNQFGEIWGNLSFNQKIFLGTLVVASVLIFYFFYHQSQQDYDVMFSGLDESDAAAIVHNLRSQGVAYKLAEGGTTILVPSKHKEELRLSAFQEDLIKSEKTVGYGALSELPFGLTDWQEKKYDQKIISDEVVNTLERINGIKKARVILAQPEDSLFASEQVEPKASVLLIVEPGLRLRTEQVKTIKHLVAHSVPGLKPENVAISDSMGNSLSDDLTAQASGGSSSQRDDYRRTLEKQKSRDILEMIAAVVGPNNAVVKVNAEINFDRVESHIKRYIPSGGTADSPLGIPVSVQQNTEAYAGGKKNTGSGGEAGMNSNIPTYSTEQGAAGDDGKGSNYQNQQVITNYEVSHEEKTVIQAPGQIERLSIAVVVNKILTQKETKELEDLVASAAGVDLSRGDSISISGMRFSAQAVETHEEALEIMKQTNQTELIMTLVQLAGVFVLTIVALFVFYNLLKRPVEAEIYEEPEESYAAFEEESSDLIAPAPLPVLEAKLDPEIEQMREAIHDMVTRDPKEAARVLQTYMKDM